MGIKNTKVNLLWGCDSKQHQLQNAGIGDFVTDCTDDMLLMLAERILAVHFQL